MRDTTLQGNTNKFTALKGSKTVPVRPSGKG